MLSPFLLVEPRNPRGATSWPTARSWWTAQLNTAPPAIVSVLAELLPGIGPTLPVAAASAIGTVLLHRDRPAGALLLLLSFPVPFLLFIGNTVPASRYLNPVLPIRRPDGRGRVLVALVRAARTASPGI